jgi:cyclopropane fatty-acyl-phospholipid synthase-like methyltransferase
MKQINLLKSLPRVIRDPKLLEARRQVKEDGEAFISSMYGYDYFDGDRKYGYGGYYRDERWYPVAKNIISHYDLHPDAKVLDTGCAKGYLVEAVCDLGMNAYGLDVSRYAVKNCPLGMVGRIHRGDILDLHFPDNSFELVLSINVVHNIDEKHVPLALQELQRVSTGNCFITVDSYRTLEEKAIFEDWVLTAKTHGYPDWWREKFAECGYDKDYDFTIWESGYE